MTVVILGIGTDLLDIGRMKRALCSDAGLRECLFTPTEIAYCQAKAHPEEHFAARFAAKEALLKALGIGASLGTLFREVSVDGDGEGRPEIILRGRIRTLARRLGVARILVSLSHTRGVAAAHVVVEGRPGSGRKGGGG